MVDPVFDDVVFGVVGGALLTFMVNKAETVEATS